jgi:hypothetical protein
MTDLHKAVFLSHASEDAGAALRICTALRSAGIVEWLGRAVDTHDGGLTICTYDPILAPLYSDPRFSELKTKLGLPH